MAAGERRVNAEALGGRDEGQGACRSPPGDMPPACRLTRRAPSSAVRRQMERVKGIEPSS